MNGPGGVIGAKITLCGLSAALLLGGCMPMPRRAEQAPRAPIARIPEGDWKVTDLKQLPPPTPGDVAAARPASPDARFQYLYGSGEAAAASEQAYNALLDAVRARLDAEKAHASARASAVLATGASLDQPVQIPCTDNQPRAVVFDVDETLLLNLGFEYDDAMHPGRPFSPARWADWERTGIDKVAAVPGAVHAVQALRDMGVRVIFNTNRDAANAAFTEAALDHAGLGPAKHGETLFLKGDADGKPGKDGRRAAIAARYCVIAMGGDQLGDFSDLFTGVASVRRAAVQAPALRGFWGRFWFVLPNPVYGTGLAGDFDQVFPVGVRWGDNGGGD